MVLEVRISNELVYKAVCGISSYGHISAGPEDQI